MPSSDFASSRDLPKVHALAQALGRTLSHAQAQPLADYLELVVAWNRKLDLTAAKGALAQIEVLLGDAFVLSDPRLVTPSARLLDVGSGAGAPAIPLLLLRPDITGTLVEPLRKRVAFLRTVVGTLGLVERVTVLERKLDPDAPKLDDTTHSFDVAMSRATFAPELWLTAGAALAPRTLVLLAQQGAPSAPAGTRLVHEQSYTLPLHDAARSIAVYDRS
jgi:16S rRNA (guanine527-N7)-methyltransferase